MSACNSHGQRKRKVDIATIIQDIELAAGQGKYSLALEKVEQSLSQWGKCKELLTIRSSISLELGDLSKAAESLDELALLGDTSAYTQFLQLRLRFAKGERDLLADIKAVLQRKDIASAIKEKIYYLSGQCQRYLGNGAEAAKAYQQAAGYASDVYCKALEYSNYLFNMHYGAKTIQEECRAAEGYNDIFSSVPQFFHRPPEKKEKLRIGYISADIREHVVLKFAYAFFRSYDRQHFEVYCYARNYEDGYSRKVMEQVDGWRNLTGMSAAEAARVIYADKIDILFDLSGHTQGSCLPILAYKPALLQISGIGYFATTGLKTVDYFLTDNYLLGGSAQAEPQLLESNGFAERLLVMPQTHFCYLPFNGLPEPGETPCRKNGYVTFGSFNNFTKVTDEVLTVWREILERVSDSRLLLKAEIFDRPEGRKAAETRLKKAGISLERIEIRGMTREYMNEYQDVDIALDTFPYPGGGTTFDALYMGVPVIALTGRTHGERFGVSILHNLGLAELCTENTTEYIERAVSLANDRELLVILHQNLRTMLKNSPLMNEKQYMQDIEHGYKLMWEQYLAEYKPMSLREVSQKIPLLRQLVIDREWQQAVELAASIEVVGHLDAYILEELAGVYIDAKDGAGAERVTVRLLAKKPKDGYSLFLRSRARFLFKDYAAVIQLAEQALASGTLDKSQEILTLDTIARANKESGQAEQAITAYWRTVEMADSLERKRQQYDNYLMALHYTVAEGQLFRQRAEKYNDLFKGAEPCKLRSRQHDKLRIGYVSPDFCKHVMSNFSRGLLKAYDRAAFEVYAYDTGMFYDEITKEFETYPDVWRDISRMTDAEAAEQIVADEIDILIDLAGHTQGNRLGIFALKPAPVQVSGIGYMSTTGVKSIDYFLGDRYLDDEEAQADFTEKMIILPNSHFLYLPWNAPPVTESIPCCKNGWITFGSFNNFTKVTDDMLQLWKQIIFQVPKSRLFLKAAAFDDVYSRKQAEQRLQAVGISLDRVIFEGWSNDYFAAYAKMDIALDTYPYPGGGTTCDALYMGVPVISLAGSRHGTRFGYSLLSNVGLGDLCAWTAAEYVDKAVQLANDLPYLQELHFMLRQRFQASALGNAEIYMADLEAAYQRIWAGYLEQKQYLRRKE